MKLFIFALFLSSSLLHADECSFLYRQIAVKAVNAGLASITTLVNNTHQLLDDQKNASVCEDAITLGVHRYAALAQVDQALFNSFRSDLIALDTKCREIAK